MGETSNFYEKCSSLSKKGDEKDERFVEIQFHRIMKREIRDIEKDIENIS